MTATLTPFEDRLLTELRGQVAPAQRRRPHRRRLLLAGVAASAAAIVGVVVVPGLGTTAAYSVAEGNAGTIRVQINRFEDAAGLEAALAEHGIEADITYVPDGGRCAPGRYEPIVRDAGGIALSLGSEMFRITLDPGTVRDGETLVVDASLVHLPDSVDPETGNLNTQGMRVIVDAEVTRGPVPACVPVAAGF